MNNNLPTLEHAGLLEDVYELPGSVEASSRQGLERGIPYSCSFCGVGDTGVIQEPTIKSNDVAARPPAGNGVIRITADGAPQEYPVIVDDEGGVEVSTARQLVPDGGTLIAELEVGKFKGPVTARHIETVNTNGIVSGQRLAPFSGSAKVSSRKIRDTVPTGGCVKLKLSTMPQRPAFPIHTAPTIRHSESGARKTISYCDAIEKFAEFLLNHRRDLGNTLVYACGQVDYFSIFAIQEVFRLLGVRNLTGNAEHCLNAGAVHNEVLTGQEGPFLTIDQGVTGPNRVYLFNGWNGTVSHPPVFRAITRRDDLDAFMIEVMITESARDLAKKLGPERILLIKPRSDPHLALAVAHEIMTNHTDAIEQRFIDQYSDSEAFSRFRTLAMSDEFAPDAVAHRIAPEAQYVDQLKNGILQIAAKFAQPETIPINIPSVGLSQTSGIVAHCLWGSVMAMLGKYGLQANGDPAGGTVRIPGQINAESEVQGLSRKYFMGRILIDAAAEAATRMDLPADAYQAVLDDSPRAALDYADITPDTNELFIFIGTQFEANMMDRQRWLAKLEDPRCKIVVIDPIPDPYTIKHADLIIPSPPHFAVTKLYQNGEWRLSLSAPGKKAPPETRSDATIIYDVMAAIIGRLEADPELSAQHEDLAVHLDSGYLSKRFGVSNDPATGLVRIDGEVDRAQLWSRVQDYMNGGSGALYCRPEHADGRPIEWDEIIDRGSLLYGGVGVSRYRLDYDDGNHQPFGDIYRRPRKFTFFTPTDEDLQIPEGIILNSGRSSMSSDRKAIQFATQTFNSGKATPLTGMPDENPCHVSPMLAEKLGLGEGDRIRLTGIKTGATIEVPLEISDRVKGDTVYMSFHKNRAQLEDGVYINDVTSSEERCPYSSQTQLKANLVELARIPDAQTGEISDEAGKPQVRSLVLAEDT